MVGRGRREAIIHMGRKEYTCDICDKTFGTKMQLTGLLRSIHIDKEDRLKCDQCNGAFSYNKTLKEHLKFVGKQRTRSVPQNLQRSDHNLDMRSHNTKICPTYVKPVVKNFDTNSHTGGTLVRLGYVYKLVVLVCMTRNF